jgi:hypothetical protein
MPARVEASEARALSRFQTLVRNGMEPASAEHEIRVQFGIDATAAERVRRDATLRELLAFVRHELDGGYDLGLTNAEGRLLLGALVEARDELESFPVLDEEAT